MVPLDPLINVGMLYSTTGYSTSDAKCAALKASMVEYGIECCNDLGIMSDDNDSSTDLMEEERPDPQPKSNAPLTTADAEGEPHLIEFDLQGPEDGDLAPVNVDEEEQVIKPASAAML